MAREITHGGNGRWDTSDPAWLEVGRRLGIDGLPSAPPSPPVPPTIIPEAPGPRPDPERRGGLWVPDPGEWGLIDTWADQLETGPCALRPERDPLTAWELTVVAAACLVGAAAICWGWAWLASPWRTW